MEGITYDAGKMPVVAGSFLGFLRGHALLDSE
jgi:hypothetical protein